MKKAAKILTIVCSCLTILYSIIYLVFYSTNQDLNLSTGAKALIVVLCLIQAALAVVFMIITLKSLNSEKKRIWIGVCNILFCGALGGIFYLIWNPNDDPKVEYASSEPTGHKASEYDAQPIDNELHDENKGE